MRSAEVAEGEAEQPSKAEKWLAEKHKINLNGLLNGVATVLGIALAIVIFVLLPQWLTGLTKFKTTGLEGWFNLIEGAIRIAVFYPVYPPDVGVQNPPPRVYVSRCGA
ncbi:MAG: DUF1385 domain-containing protein [Christensenellaceae bacterium]